MIVPPRPQSARTAVSKLAAPVTRTVDERDAAWVPATASDVTTRSETTAAARATPALRDRNTVTTLSRMREEPPRHPEPERLEADAPVERLALARGVQREARAAELVRGGDRRERERRPEAAPPAAGRHTHVVDAAGRALDMEHDMARDRRAVTHDEVPCDVVERRVVAVRELRRAYAAAFDRAPRRQARAPSRVDPHPVGPPAVLEAEVEQTAPERLVRPERPAAHLTHAALDGRAHGRLDVRARARKRERRVGRTEEQRHASELDLLVAAGEPRSVVPLDVAQHARP